MYTYSHRSMASRVQDDFCVKYWRFRLPAGSPVMAPVVAASWCGIGRQAWTVMTEKRIASNAIAIHVGFRKEDLTGIHRIIILMVGI